MMESETSYLDGYYEYGPSPRGIQTNAYAGQEFFGARPTNPYESQTPLSIDQQLDLMQINPALPGGIFVTWMPSTTSSPFSPSLAMQPLAAATLDHLHQRQALANQSAVFDGDPYIGAELL